MRVCVCVCVCVCGGEGGGENTTKAGRLTLVRELSAVQVVNEHFPRSTRHVIHVHNVREVWWEGQSRGAELGGRL